jgi:hypothetical protein
VAPPPRRSPSLTGSPAASRPDRPVPLLGPLLRPQHRPLHHPDPSGQEKNPYLYAEGDPVNRIDPSGTLSFGDVADALTPMGDVKTAMEFGGAVKRGGSGEKPPPSASGGLSVRP